MKPNISRRKFLSAQAAGMAGIALGGLGTYQTIAAEAPAAGDKPLRLAVIGTGGRGTGVMSMALDVPGTTVTAICDINPEAARKAQAVVKRKRGTEPEIYTGTEDYHRVITRDDVDAVIIATPWDLHTPMAVACMKAGKPSGVEVPIAYTLEECWELIKTHEATGTPCMQLENWSFRSDNLAVLRMIRAGLLGEITYAHCAYSHDCVNHWYFDRATGNQRWGAKFLLEHNRAQYPTHQQGPVLSWMDIGCGDYYDTITSTATGSFSIHDYFKRKFPGHPYAKIQYKQGDIVTSTVRTKKGKIIVINFDMLSPRPYDNRWTVQGTRGIYNEQRDAVYLTGVSPKYHAWEPFAPYHEKFKHPWAAATGGDHGGADGIMLSQFIKSIRDKQPMPLSLEDGVLMAAIGPLSEMSITANGKVLEVPDFTGGNWRSNKPYFALER
jgi:predicted dehydrogenase